jgi:hypothetical protein
MIYELNPNSNWAIFALGCRLVTLMLRSMCLTWVKSNINYVYISSCAPSPCKLVFKDEFYLKCCIRVKHHVTNSIHEKGDPASWIKILISEWSHPKRKGYHQVGLAIRVVVSTHFVGVSTHLANLVKKYVIIAS